MAVGDGAALLTFTGGFALAVRCGSARRDGLSLLGLLFVWARGRGAVLGGDDGVADANAVVVSAAAGAVATRGGETGETGRGPEGTASAADVFAAATGNCSSFATAGAGVSTAGALLASCGIGRADGAAFGVSVGDSVLGDVASADTMR
ncbi:MAG: hypothetical protein LH480_06895 [Rubrivivax sp.]|nr:hypothetical protein [Rubrivivax sp.]